ncbi:PPE family protein [Candidatus Mycobacterium wuenschmannii]|uniref:PPE family protein n=1 Tax=Candidatus Mycobacterium wuenschmannii TaxID=3027808 RepID=A0ABY8W1H9_9MYCO|nr:PPE family protein [Candidatus Mycobacterium wuenschmannii]WIM89612.1 PPE family protein [Candidatus Mycobacterium wuenschmannii]
MIDFGSLPPEINSGRLYAGPGAAPMLSAATAWSELAAELSAAASGYGSVISEMTSSQWVGPSSGAMVTAVMPYVGWLSTVAALAEHTADQAMAAVAAYEAAYAMTVPPPVVLTNRILLAALVATNFFGQNSAAIAATETQYADMWAQDATAMYSYSASSAAAARLKSFTSAPNTTGDSGVVQQTTPLAQSAATQVESAAQNAVPHLTSGSTGSHLLQNVFTAASTGADSTTSGELPWPFSLLPTPANNWLGLVPANYKTVFHDLLQQYFALGIGNSGWSIGQQLTFGQGTTAGAGGAWYATPEFAHAGFGSGITASTGRAVRIGHLSVPHNWSASIEEHPEEFDELEEIEEFEEFPPGWSAASTQHSAVPLGQSSVTHSAVAGANPNEVLGGVPTRFGTRPTGGFIHKYGWRYNVVARPPAGG